MTDKIHLITNQVRLTRNKINRMTNRIHLVTNKRNLIAERINLVTNKVNLKPKGGHTPNLNKVKLTNRIIWNTN